MADAQWLEIFRGYANEKLTAKLGELQDQVSAFISQAAGSKSFTADLNALKDQLSSCTRVCEERGLITVSKPRDEVKVWVTDFSGNGS